MTRIILIILLFTLSCDDPPVQGCTSPSACNFDPQATKADGTCIQPEGCNNWCPEDSFDIGELDCAGICEGNNLVDECRMCNDPLCSISGVPSPFSDEENPCQEEEYPVNQLWNSSCADCAGNPNGILLPDCTDTCGGSAILDDCQQCTEGNTGLNSNYVKDCNGECFGEAFLDDCGNCTEGNTGFIENFQKDECGECNGDGYRYNCLGNDDCGNMDCEGVCIVSAEFSITNECATQCNGAEGCGWIPDENCTDCESFGVCGLYGAELDTCQQCSGGISDHDADSNKDCNGICFGTSSEDCFGNCGGDAELDECGVCDGLGATYECGCSGIENGACDCDGNVTDECGICGGTGPDEGEDCDGTCVSEGDNLDENGYDCANECGGNAQLDDCGICNGDGYSSICIGTENCTNMDCAGNCTGTSNFGAALDCFGTCLGSALYGCDGECCAGATGDICAETDNCEICDNDSLNDCIQDCNEEWGGTAEIDNCGTCAGGATGETANIGPTDDGLYSCSDITLLVNAGVCSDSDNCANLTCPTLLWGPIEGQTYEELNGFDFAACNISSVPEYVTGFDITILNLNDIGLNNFPNNIISINTLVTVNLDNNMILDIPSNICELLENPCEIILTNNHPGLNCSEAPTCSNGETLTCD